MASIPSPRLYVSVDARCKDNGAIVPIRVVWPDGRTFGIAEVLGEPAANAPEGADERTLRYTVRVGSSVTHLFLERKRADRGFDMRWYVIPKRYA